MDKNNFDADKMLDFYVYDYMMKKNLPAAANYFMKARLANPNPEATNAPVGFLHEWWSVFWDIYGARTNGKHSEAAAAYVEEIKAKHLQQQKMQQQLQLMSHVPLQQRDMNNSRLGGPINGLNYEGTPRQSTASALAGKIYEEHTRHPNQMDSEASQPFLDARMAHMKSATYHPGQLVQGNSESVTGALQQIQDVKGEVNNIASTSSFTQRPLPVDPSSIYGLGIIQPKPGIENAGLNSGFGGLPSKGWPLMGLDQGAQVQKPILRSANEFQFFPQQQQQLLAQAQTQGNLSTSPTYDDMDAQGNKLNAKDCQMNSNDQSIGSPMHSTSSKSKRKRKSPTSSGADNCSGTGNTIGPSTNSQPSTPSTHTPGDGVPTVANLQNVGSMSKNLMIYSADGAGGASSTNQLDDNDGRDLFGTLKNNASEHAAESSNGFSLNKVACMRISNSKVVCCHFSSDGKLLASAGHDKKVDLWNMETLQTKSTSEDHTSIITDVRFRPNSTQLATSSFDTTVRLWDAEQPNYCLQTYSGHNSQVTSVDFHPTKNELFCSCDANNEIRFWNIDQNSSTLVLKGGSTKVRFQTRTGHLLAAASENLVSIFDFEADRVVHSLKGHSSAVYCLCWDINGDHLASVSRESVRIWSLSSGECIHELSTSGNIFHSCDFHPSNSSLLIIGGYQAFEFWNATENKRMTFPAHEDIISCVAHSRVSGMIASASHDKSVKIWN